MTNIPAKNRIFVNRALNMEHIQMIGFDMDHTLAPYDSVTFESLAFKKTLDKFLNAGYPEELSKLVFKPNLLMRGLLVDKIRGNLLKVDAYKYVKMAYHGWSPLPKHERHAIYNSQSYKAENFLSVDTFFSLSEVQLFVEIVDFMKKNPGKIKKSFSEIYNDLRIFIDTAHADGSIKNEVLAHPDKYIQKDKFLAKTLVRLLDAGKSLFLLTNSMFDYTDQILSYVMSDGHFEFNHWKEYWDIIIVGARKPSFFSDSQPFFEVVEDSGLLKHHNGQLNPRSVYYGGNAKLFEKLTGYKGDEILYVGDHVFGDVIQSKGFLNWRTMLIVEELEKEIPIFIQTLPLMNEISKKQVEKEDIDEELQQVRSLMAATTRKLIRAKNSGESTKKIEHLEKELINFKLEFQKRKSKLEKTITEIKDLVSERGAQFNPTWGELMKVGLERSRFALQVKTYACIYSARASNLRFYSPFKRFHSFYEHLPHELLPSDDI
jgi:5'-nucleotidase